MKALTALTIFLLGVIAGASLDRGLAQAGEPRGSAAVSSLPREDFAATGEDVQVERIRIEGHDVWLARGYQKLGLSHHPDCAACAEE
jgi:hypothetical protein